MTDPIGRYMKEHNDTKPTPKQLQLWAKKQKDIPNLGFKQARELVQNYDPNNPKFVDPPKSSPTSESTNTSQSNKNTTPNSKKATPKQTTSSRKRTISTEKSSVVYLIDDQVVLAKDRMGIIRYAGRIKELNDEVYYGIELTNGVLGNSDGTFKGTRYFQTDGNRAVFVKRDQIRRKMTLKDQRRKDSFLLTKSMKESKSTPIIKPTNSEEKDNTYQLQKQDSIVTNNKNFHKINDEENPDTSTLLNRFTQINRNETVFQYIWRQNELLRYELLDIYCHPLLNPLLKDSFIELQAVNNHMQQSMMWEALMERWKKHV